MWQPYLSGWGGALYPGVCSHSADVCKVSRIRDRLSSCEFRFPFFLIIFFELHLYLPLKSWNRHCPWDPGLCTWAWRSPEYHQEFSYFSVSPFISSFPSFFLIPSSLHPFLLSFAPFPLPPLLLTSTVCSLLHVQLIPAVFPEFWLPFCFIYNLLSLRRASDTAQWHIPLIPVLNINTRFPVQSKVWGINSSMDCRHSCVHCKWASLFCELS